MATTIVRISAPVGIRNGRVPMTNAPGDLDKITELFDRIPIANGGSMEIGGVWASSDSQLDALIAEVTAQIVTFQTVNRLPTIDGVLDPYGGTLRLMNQVAREPGGGGGLMPLTGARVMPPPGNRSTQVNGQSLVATAESVSGAGRLVPSWLPISYSRRLVYSPDSDIHWFGVVVPDQAAPGIQSFPHLNFTPTPWQGGYQDPGYEAFSSWGQLWDDYTTVIGGQIAAAGVDQILVLPFYKNSQPKNFGSFNTNWRAVVSDVVTAALLDIDPTCLRDTYTFDRIVTSSFSNGWVAHHHFQTQAQGAADMTIAIYDLDGVAGGSNWVPPNGMIYRNRAIPAGRSNPQGHTYYVGGRWDKFVPFYGGNINTHACCRNHLLFHGLFYTF